MSGSYLCRARPDRSQDDSNYYYIN
ncbi:TPA_asm: hypothetical protein HUJ06_000215 [Nelumbo nucifera]|uniref:Uncharacterized protein n=1 Tax=Nelumbo nucifera TaxID=4432 RepID=A0A822ZXG8_NELNU|nr:TPA_asm: hypothetical protein HUJ06_031947 [Nelumbo nucifera]DAD49713.1 TPA_asm: hypothetical protein HUJ06_000075 [Nelumbo nucifera]DAD49725.1 TPA_asm: hypothetical protein HUJ06_000155 [Nelumbo nucifera]DAD49737.1 TPA_asm: hypothetical protein HUJ06_000215 [Nelumbo nucifera]